MKTVKEKKNVFTARLMDWHATENDRSLPWKQEKDPYKIWLSEIILQQTRAEQGRPYYLKFLEAFPTIMEMAAADDEAVFRLWQGLGYYNRCRNMLATARYISTELKGKFPSTYNELVQLKGIGPYTAAAIASFAFGEACAVVDGNVYRVLARHFAIGEPYDTATGKKIFTAKAQELLDLADAAGYNQAIMDLGATVCTPRNARCSICPLKKSCIAYTTAVVDLLPVRSKKIVVKKRYFNYLIIQAGSRIWLSKRTAKDIWQNLYEPYLLETAGPVASLDGDDLFKSLNIKRGTLAYEGKFVQRLTHQLIETHFYSVNIPKPLKMPVKQGIWLPISDLRKIAFPKTLVSFLEKKLYF